MFDKKTRTWPPSDLVEISKHSCKLHEYRVAYSRFAGPLVPSVVMAADDDVSRRLIPAWQATNDVVHSPAYIQSMKQLDWKEE